MLSSSASTVTEKSYAEDSSNFTVFDEYPHLIQIVINVALRRGHVFKPAEDIVFPDCERMEIMLKDWKKRCGEFKYFQIEEQLSEHPFLYEGGLKNVAEFIKLICDTEAKEHLNIFNPSAECAEYDSL